MNPLEYNMHLHHMSLWSDEPKLIPVDLGVFATVDAEDYPHLSQYNWHLDPICRVRTVVCGMWPVFLADKISGRKNTHHRDGNVLDCRKENLFVLE